MPTTASPEPDGLPPSGRATSDPADPDAQARWEQGPMEVLVMPPATNPVLPYVGWPVPPTGVGEDE